MIRLLQAIAPSNPTEEHLAAIVPVHLLFARMQLHRLDRGEVVADPALCQAFCLLASLLLDGEDLDLAMHLSQWFLGEQLAEQQSSAG